MARISIYDSTLRDGAQAQGISYSVEDKLKIVERLDALGVSYIEAGNPGSNPKDLEFQFKAGPVFSSIVLIDEINRAPAKTQSALFEVMEERQATVDGNTYKMATPFIVLATQNPVEQEGTYRLPEAQLDRFLFKISVGYPSLEEEVLILQQQQHNTTTTTTKKTRQN